MRALGASLTATTLRDYTMIGAGFLASDFDRGLDLIGDAVMHPAFSDEQIGRARTRSPGPFSICTRTWSRPPRNRSGRCGWARILRSSSGRDRAASAPDDLRAGSGLLRALLSARRGRAVRGGQRARGRRVRGGAHDVRIVVGPGRACPHDRGAPSSGATRLRIRIIDLPAGPVPICGWPRRRPNTALSTTCRSRPPRRSSEEWPVRGWSAPECCPA